MKTITVSSLPEANETIKRLTAAMTKVKVFYNVTTKEAKNGKKNRYWLTPKSKKERLR